MSSHREAPEISKDPVADSTDVYAFVSPDKPDTVTLIANYIPLQKPDGGPNFYEFADDVVYDIRISFSKDAGADLVYRFRFNTEVTGGSFLYNNGTIDSLDSDAWLRKQTYTLSKFGRGGREQVLGKNLACPPVNVGPRSTPNYADLAEAAVHTLGSGGNIKVFAGQRADAFHVDLGSIFDLAGIRALNGAHKIPLPMADAVNGLQSFNVHTLAIQLPITAVTGNGKKPTDFDDPFSTIGVWTTAMRQRSRMFDQSKGKYVGSGAFQSVSRLGNPLFNEVIVPMELKDKWNASKPLDDKAYAKYVTRPELAQLLPVLYPGAFPNLQDFNDSGDPRADLAAILLTGIPKAVGIPGFQNNTGTVQADMLRLNLAIPPSENPNNLGLLASPPDAAGFPNGRRPADDVVAIELQAIAGKTIPLVDPDYEPDDAATGLNDGTENTNAELLGAFPYLGLPGGGYETQPGTTNAGDDSGAGGKKSKAGR